jgi:hypothetical protein
MEENLMELDDEYFQTIFETPLQTKEFVEVMGRLEKAAMDAKALKSMEFALRLLDAHTDVPEIAKIVDQIKAAMAAGGKGDAGDKGYPAPGKGDTAGYGTTGQPGYGTPGKADDEDKKGKKVEKSDLKKEDATSEKDQLLLKVDDPEAQAQLKELWKEKDAQGTMLKEANAQIAKAHEQIEELKRAEKVRGYMAKVAEFDTLPQDGSLVDHLMEIEGLGQEALDRELKILEMANEANKRGKVMDEIGTSEIPATGVAAELEKGVKGILAKSKDLTDRAARIQYVKENPDVYERLEKERMARGS